MRLRVIFLALVLSVVPVSALGQALVDGYVVNGSPIHFVPNIDVHLVNNQLKPPVDLVIKTDESGYYVFSNVVVAEGYTVEVYSDTGKILGADLKFNLTQDGHTALPSIDISKGINVAQAAKTSGLLLNDTGTALGANISNAQLRELPLYNRTFLALGLIQPGVHEVEQGSALRRAAFSIAGSPASAGNFLLNSLSTPQSAGIDNLASSNNQAIPFQVNDSVQDFRVVYADPDLRYGQGSGGVIDVVTSQSRLGATGAWHGSSFGYFNADALNAGMPLSVYSNSGFFKAAAYANTPIHAVETINYKTNAEGDFSSYAPQSYNSLYNLMAPLGGANTSVGAAGSFNPASILSTFNSHSQPVHQEQFGISAGGPLLNDKVLLFLGYEATYIDNPTPTFERVPTTLDEGNCNATSTTDCAISSGILGLLPAPNVGYGTSNNADAGIFGFYRGTAPNYTHVHNIHIRPDVPLPNLRSLGLGALSLSYTAQILDQLHDDTLPSNSTYPGNGVDRKAQNQSASITHNLPLGKHLNVFNIGFTQFRVDEIAQDKGFNLPGLPASSEGLNSVVISGIDPRTTGAAPGKPGLIGGWYDAFWNACGAGTASDTCSSPQTTSPSPITPSLDGDFPLARIGAPLSAPSAHRDSELFISDLAELNLGKSNTLTFGGEYRHQQNYSSQGGLVRGLIVSNNIGEFTSDSETCISCGAAFQHPSYDYELRQLTPYIGDQRSSSFGFFGEDKFQPFHRMTLTLGARYSYFGEPLDTKNRLWNYNFTDLGLVRQGSATTYDAFDYQCGAGDETFLDSLYGERRVAFVSSWSNCKNGKFVLPRNRHDVTGRGGISYSLDSLNKTVFRAAAGGYFDHLSASYNQKLLENRPNPFNIDNPTAIYGQNFDSSACPGQSQCAFGLGTLNFSSFVGQNPPTLPGYNFNNYQAASGANVMYARDIGALKTPYSIQFSAGIEHQIHKSLSIELDYVGSVSRHLPLVYDANFLNEFYCTQSGSTACNNNTFFPVFTDSNIGASSYHSAILRLRTEQWHGLSLNAAFTYAKSLDDVAGSNFPQSVDSLWSQLFGRELFGVGNPVAFALGANTLAAGTPAGQRGIQLRDPKAARAMLTGGNIPSFNAISSALTTTGERPITVSTYNLPQNPVSFQGNSMHGGGDHGPSDFDVRSRAVADFVYKVPNSHMKWQHGFLISGIFVAQGGQPFTILSGPAFGQVTQRINIPTGTRIKTTGNPKNYISISGVGTDADLLPGSDDVNCPNLYAQPTLYKSPTATPCFGDSGRNAFTGPKFVSQDVAIEKALQMHNQSQSLILRMECFNLFDTANYYNPISEISLDGAHTNPEFGLVRSTRDPLQIQFAVRYSF